MNKPAQHLMEPPRAGGLADILRAWRLLLIGFLAGGLLGAAAYSLFPPAYRAAAVVVLDQNLEQSYPLSPDREVFYFLERETTRLEELAWSDDVLQRVVDEVRDISMVKLREGALQLAQPADGGWRMYGIAADPARAKLLAGAWADAFEKEVSLAVAAAHELETVQAEMQSLTENAQNDVSSGEIAELQDEIDALNFRVRGIHPLVQVYRSQEKGILVERVSSQGTYVLAGALTGLVLMIIAGAFFQRSDADEA